METAEDSISQSSDEALVLIRINVPDLGVQKCMQFHKDELVWDVKQQVLAALPKELKESFNYGLFSPPQNGKAGKFLDEERPLSNYPLPGPIGYLELKYKRRVYKMMNVDEKQIKQLHTRANLRRLLDYVQGGHVEKVTKLCTKGLDPNFHCPETGETPLTLAASLKKSARMILALVNGGAHLDYRTRDGCTSMHRAVEKNNHEAIKTLLDLGASPNYRDNKGLTPLYYTVLYTTDPHICELLLHDHAHIGAQDFQGWQEVHQACRNGLVHHLEHLLFYGADMNARNASGNTPLHVCAVNDQESCARVLLFRGAEKEALNFANQTPYQVAVIAGNLALAEVIQKHRPEDVVPFRETPKYNPRRRSSLAAAIIRTHSDPRLELTLGGKPPSPSPSNRSLPPFSSASSLSETSTGSSTCTQPSLEDSEGTAVTDKSNTSDSSGVCTSNSGNSYEQYQVKPTTPASLNPGMMCVCLEPYNSGLPDHLVLSPGDIVEVLTILESDMLEGRTKTQQGLFPISCVQEVRLRNPETKPPQPTRVEGRREMREMNNRIQNQNAAQRTARKIIEEPRTVVLHKGKKGYGFVLRGAKATSPLMEMQPSESCPALQYLDDVDKGGVADLAGLKKGDYLLAINGEDVSQASHEHVVNLIRKSGDLVAMTVITVYPPGGSFADKPPSNAAMRQCSTLPRKLMRGKAPVPPRRDPRTTLSVGRARARSMVAGLAEIEALNQTLQQYEAESRSGKSSSIESLPYKPAASGENQQQPVKTASIRSRPTSKRVTAAELQEIFARQGSPESGLSTSAPQGGGRGGGGNLPKVYGSVAEMKRNKAGKQRGSDTRLHKDFSSTPDLNHLDANRNVTNRRSRSQENIAMLNMRNSRHSWAAPPQGYSRLIDARNCLPGWGSIEDLRADSQFQGQDREGPPPHPPHRDITSTPPRGPPPPPTHPPPPPPVGQVVKVDVSRARSEYANVRVESRHTVLSSFRPPDGTKVYATPEELGFPPTGSKAASLRSCSLPAKLPPPPPGSTPSSESETSGDSGTPGGYATFTKTPQPPPPPDTVSTDSGNSSERGGGPPVPPAPNPYAQPFRPYTAVTEDGYLPTGSDGSEPFIPEPDYDLTEDEDLDDDERTPTSGLPPPSHPPIPPPPRVYEKPTLIQRPQPQPPQSETLPTDSPDQPCEPSSGGSSSPHKDAKRAIVEARDRLRSVQREHVTVVYVSTVDVENNIRVERRDSVGSAGSSSGVVAPLERRDSRTSIDSGELTPHHEPVKKPPLPSPGTRVTKTSSGAPPTPTTPVNKQMATTPQNIQGSPDFKQLIAQKVAERRRRVMTPEAERPPGGALSDNTGTPPPGGGGGGTVETPTVTKVREQISVFERKTDPVTGAPRPSSSPLRIPKRSDSERSKVRSEVVESARDSSSSSPPIPFIKMSKSCPTDLQDEVDNSSSGVSSDVEGPNEPGRQELTTPPISGPETKPRGVAPEEPDSDDSDDPRDPTWLLHARLTEADILLREEIEAGLNARRPLTKNAVSLVKLPPPIETGETDAESDIAEPSPLPQSPVRKSSLPHQRERNISPPPPPTTTPPQPPVKHKRGEIGAANMAAATAVLRPGTGLRQSTGNASPISNSVAGGRSIEGGVCPVIRPIDNSHSQIAGIRTLGSHEGLIPSSPPPQSQPINVPSSRAPTDSRLSLSTSPSPSPIYAGTQMVRGPPTSQGTRKASFGVSDVRQSPPPVAQKHTRAVDISAMDSVKLGGVYAIPSHVRGDVRHSPPMGSPQVRSMSSDIKMSPPIGMSHAKSTASHDVKMSPPLTVMSMTQARPASNLRQTEASCEAKLSPPTAPRVRTARRASDSAAVSSQPPVEMLTQQSAKTAAAASSLQSKQEANPDPAELERSIEQSLQLIQMHVDSLHEVNVLAGLVPPPPEFEGEHEGGVPPDVGMIPPPPDFSDDVHVPLAAHARELLLVSSSLPQQKTSQPAATGTLRNSKLALKLGYSGTSVTGGAGGGQGPGSATSRLVRPKTLTTDVTTTTQTLTASMAPAAPPKSKNKLSPEAHTPPSGVCNGTLDSPGTKAIPQPPVQSKKSPESPTAKIAGASQRDFQSKPLQQWTTRDVSDWLESLFMPEYKVSFEAAGINGSRLATIDNMALLELGVKRVGHRLNMERSLRRHMTQK